MTNNCQTCITVASGAGVCPAHGPFDEDDVGRFLPDGREAEELRAGIEALMEQSTDGMVTTSQLQELLDKVDARDSLSYLEAKNRTKKQSSQL